MKVLFFDTETTDRNPSFARPVQLAWSVHNENGKLISSQNHIIKPFGFVIPHRTVEIHGITNEKANNEGKPFEEVMDLFAEDWNDADLVVAHNISYDYTVITSELPRQGYPSDALKEIEKMCCTMKKTTNYVGIKSWRGYKWPTLSELHFKLFKKDFEGAHDAMNDVNATSKCFFELCSRGVKGFEKYLKN